MSESLRDEDRPKKEEEKSKKEGGKRKEKSLQLWFWIQSPKKLLVFLLQTSLH